MRKRIVAGMITLMSICLVGCQQTPDEVQNEIDYKNQVQQEIKKQDKAEDTTENKSHLDTIEHIFANAEEVMAKPYANLRFQNKLELVQPKQCGKVKFQVVKDFDKKADSILSQCLGEDYHKEYATEEPNYVPRGPEYNDPNTGLHIGIGENGFTIYKNDVTENEASEQETFFLANGYEDKQKEFTLEDGTITLQEAVERGKKIVNDWNQILGSEAAYIPYRLIENKNSETGKSSLTLEYQFAFGDVGNYGLAEPLKEGKETVYFPTTIEISSVREEAYNFTRDVEYEIPVMEETYDKIISLETVLQSVSDELADYHVYDVQGITLEYLLETEEKEENSLKNAGKTYTAEPYWIVYLDVTPNWEVYIAVNCLTGESKFVNRAQLDIME